MAIGVLLTGEQRQAVEEAKDTPLTVVDPITNAAYVLVRAEVYERLTEGDFDPREAYPFVDKVMAEDDANDPHLGSYQTLSEGGGG